MPQIERLPRQLAKTSTWALGARAPFQGQATKILSIPQLIDQHDHHIEAVNEERVVACPYNAPALIQEVEGSLLHLIQVRLCNVFILARSILEWPREDAKGSISFRRAVAASLTCQGGGCGQGLRHPRLDFQFLGTYLTRLLISCASMWCIDQYHASEVCKLCSRNKKSAKRGITIGRRLWRIETLMCFLTYLGPHQTALPAR